MKATERISPGDGRPNVITGFRRLLGNGLAFLLLMIAARVSSAEPHPGHSPSTFERATFGGGCFWCLEALFQTIDGVKSVTSGFAGGTVANPSYEQVCTGTTGHAEVIQVEYDPAKISYEKLLNYFWQAHDPTTLNRQGDDVGTQYRSVILCHNEAQKLAAEKSKTAAAHLYQNPIVTQIVPLTQFYRAEDYHQNYFRNHRQAPYCRLVIRPKLDKWQK
jgi:peptide-methionine (S)-S-oxide reductase